MRTMWDGIDLDAKVIRGVWRQGDLVGCYVAGNSFIWDAAQRALFPADSLVTITLTASYTGADVLDVEAGGATDAQVQAWIAAKHAAGYWRPTVYHSLNGMAGIRASTGPYVLGRDYDIWVADYDDSLKSVYPLAAAKQYRDAGPYDVSAVYDDNWPHRAKPATTTGTAIGAPAAVWPAGLTLREGATGGAVRVLQQALHDSGQYGARGLEPIDGIFGAATLAAVRNFQADKHLVVDGIAGNATRAALGV